MVTGKKRKRKVILSHMFPAAKQTCGGPTEVCGGPGELCGGPGETCGGPGETCGGPSFPQTVQTF